MPEHKFKDVILEIKGKIGVIKFNRPKLANSFGGSMTIDTIAALRILDNHPETIFTVITGSGRFFSAGADVREGSLGDNPALSDVEKKLQFVQKFAVAGEMMRAIIDHRKVVVVALNGPAVGAGAAWIPPVADILLSSDSAYLHINFSSLGLVPENGSAFTFAQSMGNRRTNEFVMFGRKLNAQEMESWGVANKVFPTVGFEHKVLQYLQDQLEVNDGKSMMEAKRLQNAATRDQRIVAVWNAIDALAERFVDGEPFARFRKITEKLNAQSKARQSKM